MRAQARIEFPGAIYQVTSRGHRRERLFFTDEDRTDFLRILRKALDRSGVVLHAYVLLPNHFHALVTTAIPNLSRFLHYLKGEYAKGFNRRHRRCGHVFQGRYRAVLVQQDGYFRAVFAYILDDPQEGPRFVRDLLAKYLGKGAPSPAAAVRNDVFLGDDAFGEQLSRRIDYGERLPDGVVGRRLWKRRLDLGRMCARLAKLIGEDPGSLYVRSRKGLHRRDLAVYVCREVSHCVLRVVGQHFGLGTSGAGSAVARVRRQMVRNRAYARRVQRLISRLRRAIEAFTRKISSASEKTAFSATDGARHFRSTRRPTFCWVLEGPPGPSAAVT